MQFSAFFCQFHLVQNSRRSPLLRNPRSMFTLCDNVHTKQLELYRFSRTKFNSNHAATMQSETKTLNVIKIQTALTRNIRVGLPTVISHKLGMPEIELETPEYRNPRCI
jgi:hypothetical protein